MKPLLIAAFLSLSSGLLAADIEIIKAGSTTDTMAPSTSFTGNTRVTRLFQTDAAAQTSGALVSFEARARTRWHTHPLGQTLIVISGSGRVQQWGGPLLEIRPGDIVRIPPNTKHWHGACSALPMTHIAIAQYLEGKAVQWMEEVDDSQYEPPAAQTTIAPSFRTLQK